MTDILKQLQQQQGQISLMTTTKQSLRQCLRAHALIDQAQVAM